MISFNNDQRILTRLVYDLTINNSLSEMTAKPLGNLGLVTRSAVTASSTVQGSGSFLGCETANRVMNILLLSVGDHLRIEIVLVQALPLRSDIFAGSKKFQLDPKRNVHFAIHHPDASA